MEPQQLTTYPLTIEVPDSSQLPSQSARPSFHSGWGLDARVQTSYSLVLGFEKALEENGRGKVLRIGKLKLEGRLKNTKLIFSNIIRI